MITFVLDVFEKDAFSSSFKVNTKNAYPRPDVPPENNRQIALSFPTRYNGQYETISGEYSMQNKEGDGCSLWFIGSGVNFSSTPAYDTTAFKTFPSFTVHRNLEHKDTLVCRQMSHSMRDLDASFFLDYLSVLSSSGVVISDEYSFRNFRIIINWKDREGNTHRHECIESEGEFEFADVQDTTEKEIATLGTVFSEEAAETFTVYPNARYDVDVTIAQEHVGKKRIKESHKRVNSENKIAKLEELKVVSGYRSDPVDTESLIEYFRKDRGDGIEIVGRSVSKKQKDAATSFGSYEKATYDLMQGDMRGVHIDSLYPGKYTPSDYSKFYTDSMYDKDRDTRIRCAEWSLLYLADIVYDVNCVSLWRRKEKKDETGEQDTETAETENTAKTKKKKKKKYEYSSEQCDVSLGKVSFRRLVAHNRSKHGGEYPAANAFVPVKGCSGFSYVMRDITTTTILSTMSTYFGSVVVPCNNFFRDITLVPRVRVQVCGVIPSSLCESHGIGTGIDGRAYLLKVPTTSSRVLKRAAIENEEDTEFPNDWYYCSATIDIISNDMFGVNKGPATFVHTAGSLNIDKKTATGMLYFKEGSRKFERNSAGVFKDGTLEIYGKPYRNSAWVADCIDGTYGEKTVGVALAVTGKKIGANACGGIYCVDEDKYYVLDQVPKKIPFSRGEESANVTPDWSGGYMLLSGHLPVLKLKYERIAQSNSFSTLLFMPTMSLIKLMSMRFAENVNLQKLKEFPDRLYRLHMWCVFVNAVLDGKYVSTTDTIYYEEDTVWKTRPGDYEKFGFAIRPEDRPAVYYGKLLNADLLDEIACEVLSTVNRLYVKDEKDVRLRKWKVYTYACILGWGGCDDRNAHLSRPSREQPEEGSTVKVPVFKRYTDSIPAFDLISAGTPLEKSSMDTTAAVNKIDSRISLLERIANFMVGDKHRVYVPYLKSLSVSVAENDDSSLTQFEGFTCMSCKRRVELVGASTLPGVVAEIYSARQVVKGLKCYPNSIRIPPTTTSSLSFMDCGEAADLSLYRVQGVIYSSSGCIWDFNTKCSVQAESGCFTAWYDGDLVYEGETDQVILDAVNADVQKMQEWYSTYGEDIMTNGPSVPMETRTDSYYYYVPSGYLYDFKDIRTIQIKGSYADDDVKPMLNTAIGADSPGYTNTDIHGLSRYPGDDNEGRLFSYADSPVDNIISFSRSSQFRGSLEPDTPEQFSINSMTGNNITIKLAEKPDDYPTSVMYDVTDFISLDNAHSNNLLGIPDDFRVK